MPRIRGRPKPPVPVVTFSDGTAARRSSVSVMPEADSRPVSSAVIAIGTFCAFSERFCAVTTISPLPLSAAVCAGGGAAVCCAHAGWVAASASRQTPAVIPARIRSR
jgi:hypothetical protein